MQADAAQPERAPIEGYGVFGGVFDPVHDGHLAAARAALAALPIDGVRFLLAGSPPHKPSGAPAPAEHRLRMLSLALAGEPRFSVDDRELHRAGPSYTVLTLRELAREHPGRRIHLLIGADNAATLRTWHRAEEILALSDPVIVPRPGYAPRFERHDLPFVPDDRREALNRLSLGGVSLDISSSEVRERVRAGLPLDGWVPLAVAEYIALHGLYR